MNMLEIELAEWSLQLLSGSGGWVPRVTILQEKACGSCSAFYDPVLELTQDRFCCTQK